MISTPDELTGQTTKAYLGRLLARRMSAPPPPSVTAAGVLPLPDGAAPGEHPGARVSMPETIIWRGMPATAVRQE